MSEKLSTVIVNWEKPYETIACLKSLQDAIGDLSFVILVDNGSKDNSVELLQERFPDVRYIALETNLGFAGGSNVGIREALKGSATNIFLLNNDAVVEQITIPKLLSSPGDIAVPKIFYYPDTSRIWSAGAMWRSFPPAIKMRGYKEIDHGQYDTPTNLEFATACALMVKRLVFETIGGFDEDYVNYMEDYDFCLRARMAGFSIHYVPDSRISHKVASTLSENSCKRWWYLGRNSVLFFRKHDRYSRWTLACHTAWVVIRELIKGKPVQIRSYLQGFIAGVKFIRTQNE